MDYTPSPKVSEMSTPRFTEHLNSSPPYQHFFPESPPSPAPQYGDGGIDPMGHRISNKERPLSPELMSPGLESIRADEGEKEVVPLQYRPQTLPADWQGQYGAQEQRQDRTFCGMSKKAFFILLAVIAILILGIALGVGLGVGLSNNKSSSSKPLPSSNTTSPGNSTFNTEYLIGGAINPAYYTNIGAFNGSGIALASESFATALQDGTEGSLVLYFQHHTGEIRNMQLDNEGAWLGGSSSEIVAQTAKNSTPLSAVSYSVNGTNQWHVFYIDTDNIIKQRSNSNTTNIWVDGPLTAQNLQVNDADQVGMQACWYGSDYGDSDYSHTPLPGESPGQEALTNEYGMHLWFASNDTTFQQYGWRYGDPSWTWQQSWPNKNGHAGVGCYSWESDSTVTYVMLVNEENTVEFWWKDTNTTLMNTTTHPINQWVNTSIAVNDVNPATSLGYTNYFYAQMENDMINGYNISWAAENTTILIDSDFTVDGLPGVSGTHLSVSALPNQGGGNTLVVFYQTNGSDVTEYTRDWIAGQWTSVDIPIPAQ